MSDGGVRGGDLAAGAPLAGVRIVDAGLGWDAELGQGISSRLSWARPLDADGSPGVDGDDDRWYWSLRYEH